MSNGGPGTRHGLELQIDSPRTAIKSSDGKAPMSLLPLRALAEVAHAFWSGLRDGRQRWDWMKGADWSLYEDAALRHLQAYQGREDRDPQSGRLALAHAVASLLILLTYQLLGIGNDDRPESVKTDTEKSPNA